MKNICSFFGHADLIKFLVEEAGASVSARTRDGFTPLFLAAQVGQVMMEFNSLKIKSHEEV